MLDSCDKKLRVMISDEETDVIEVCVCVTTEWNPINQNVCLHSQISSTCVSQPVIDVSSTMDVTETSTTAQVCKQFTSIDDDLYDMLKDWTSEEREYIQEMVSIAWMAIYMYITVAHIT